jgi:ATP-binding cassette subfamily C protein CydD
LVKELPGLKVSVATSVAVGLLATASVVVQAVALAHVLASAMPGAPAGDRAHWLVLFGCGACVRAVVALLGEVLAGASASRAIASLRSRLVATALGRLGGSAAPPSGPGDIAALAGRGLDALDVYVGRCLPDLVLAAAAPLALLVCVGALDWISALVMAVVVALFPIFGALVGRTSMSLAAQRWRQVEDLGRQVADLFDGLAVLRAFGRAADYRERMAKTNEALRQSTTKVLRVAFLSALVLDTLGSVSVALVAVPLGLRLLTGGVHLSAALAVLIIAPEVFLPLRRASAEFHESSEGLAASARVMAIIGSSPEPAGRRDVMVPGPVELRSVTVELPGREIALLREVSLTISPGETVVLVGPSGAGKSTLISLLLGFTSPGSGQVTAGGEDLRDIDLEAWRRLITYLPERPTLLSASLADNLRLADAEASEDDLFRALVQAGAPELMAGLAQGWETRLGDGGRPVSAGERQRIALARVFLRPRPLYLLDEPTVHLDQAAEVQVLDSLRPVLRARSALIVSHRPAVLALADRALMVRDGELVDVTAELVAQVPA